MYLSCIILWSQTMANWRSYHSHRGSQPSADRRSQRRWRWDMEVAGAIVEFNVLTVLRINYFDVIWCPDSSAVAVVTTRDTGRNETIADESFSIFRQPSRTRKSFISRGMAMPELLVRNYERYWQTRIQITLQHFKKRSWGGLSICCVQTANELVISND